MPLDSTFVLSVVSGVLMILGTVALTKRLLRKSVPKTLVDKDAKYSLKLLKKEFLNHDTRIFRFELPSKNHVLGLPVGQHVFISAIINGSLIIRPYTPISSDDDLGFMELLVKIYFKNVHPKFPDGGKMTQYLEYLKIGDTIDVRGPNGLLVYDGNDSACLTLSMPLVRVLHAIAIYFIYEQSPHVFDQRHKSGTFKIQPKKILPAKVFIYKNLCMIAGGSGITPMYQIIKHILKDKGDGTKVWLIYANQTEDDILLREELDKLSQNHADFHVWYTLDRPKPGWKYSSGFITAEMISAHLSPPGDDVLVTMCGPPPMIQYACMPTLDKLGYAPEHRFVF